MNTSLYGGLIEISPDGQPIAPDLVLAYRGGTKQGIIHNVQSLTNKNDLAQAAEITFDVYKKVDNVTCELWNDIRDFRLIYIPHLDTASFNPWYELSVETDEDDATIKHCQGVHLQEAELGQLSLNDIEINTEDDIARDDYTPTIIYDPTNPEGSALDRILKDKASHYTIVHVDSSIANLQRTFSWDGSTIKGAFDDIANEVECLFVYGESVNNDGKIHRTISVYDLNDVCMECGERGTFTNKMCTKCNSANIKFGYGSDSGIFLSHENFAGNISYSSNKDEVKNCFRLVAGDDLMTATIRNINPSGSQYIWYFSDSVRADMSKTLRDKLSTYEKEYASYSSDKKIDIPSTVISDYNTLINKYKLYDSSLMNVKYPIVGYSSLTDLYYSALNFYSLLKTTLAPVSERGTKTTAAQEIKKLTTNTLSPLGIQNANKASVSTVTLALQNYAKVFVDTSLYRITATNDSYSGNVWKGTITLSKDFDDLVGEDGRIEEIRKSNVTTQQQVDKVQTDVNTYIVRVDAINGRVESIEQTTECFSMEDAGLRITRKISSQDPSMQLSMLLSEQKLSFYQGTDEVAYFSNNKLYVTDAEILDRLQLGKFAFIPRSNGNLSFRYLGGQ